VITLIKTLITGALSFTGLSSVFTYWKLIALVLAIGGMGFEGWHLARSWDREAALVAEAATLKQRLATISFLQASDAKRAKDDAAALKTLKDTASVTPKNTTACLPRVAVGRVRAIK
jgi:hypothetical protein